MHRLAVCLVSVMSIAAASDPQDLDKALQGLKDADSKGDAAQVKAQYEQTCGIAKEIISSPAPASADEKDEWAQHVSYAKAVQLQADYVLYTAAAKGPAATTGDLLATLERLDPASKYMDVGYASYFYALRETGAAAKIPAAAERAVAHFPNNDAALMVLADTAMARKQPDRAIAFAERLVTVVNSKARPEGVPAADWERMRSTELGRGYWIEGVLRCEKTDYYKGNENLRAALPLIKGNDAMMAPALFYLGLANYQLGKQTLNRAQVREAAKFSEQAVAYKGPLAQQAYHNALVMKQEAAGMP